MTCEVVVMNKLGISLAADSAVTLPNIDGNRSKVYYTAEKLFSLSPKLPVAIMTFGLAEIMGVPWEVVVKIYAQKLDGRRFDTLAEYAQDFLAFIEGADWLFPVETQTRLLQSLIRESWKQLYVDKLEEALANEGKISDKAKHKKLAEIIQADHELWERYPDLVCVGADYGLRVRETFAEALDQVEQEIFEGLSLTPTLQAALRKTVEFAYQKEWFHPRYQGHVVIAGMGETEPFPVLLEYDVGTLAAGKLRYRKSAETRVGVDADAVVAPFAQAEIILSIMQGIHPRICDQFVKLMIQPFHDTDDKEESERAEEQEKELRTLVQNEVLQPYSDPLLSAVSALPREDLAKMAEALVNLTAFFMRMSVNEEQTVSEPIDVALLSKGDGFVWVKHKDVRALTHER